MRDYKDETIERLCAILNTLEDCGCLLGEEKDEYYAIMNEYTITQSENENEIIATADEFGSHSHEGHHSYIAYSILNAEGVREMEYLYFHDDIYSANDLLRAASEMICFSDCSDEIVEAIVIQGWKVEYVGWQPNMLFEFRDQESGEIIWSCRFPQWDH